MYSPNQNTLYLVLQLNVLDKDKQLSIFKNEVVATDDQNNVLKTDYAEFNKKTKRKIYD